MYTVIRKEVAWFVVQQLSVLPTFAPNTDVLHGGNALWRLPKFGVEHISEFVLYYLSLMPAWFHNN